MDFQGPDAADLDNVGALNRAYLDGLSQPLAVAPVAPSGTASVIEKLTALSARKSDCLSQKQVLAMVFSCVLCFAVGEGDLGGYE